MKTYTDWLSLARKSAAELVGTFLLALVVRVLSFATANYPAVFQALYTPFLVGLTLAFIVVLFGGVSGANVNPAVTIALFVVRKISPSQLVAYIVAQLVGAFAALYAVQLLVGASQAVTVQATSFVWWGEAAGAFMLVLGVIASIQGKLKPIAAAPVIGTGLAIGVSLSLLSSKGILNPAIALSLGARSLPYIVAPILGACAASLFYTLVFGPDHSEEK